MIDRGAQERAPARVPDEVDTVIVGAGLAGLSCAADLASAGARVVVLEAQSRVGGRTLSARVGRGVFDLGGQWLGHGQDRAYALADRLGLGLFPTFCQGKKILERGGRVTTYRGEIPPVSPLSLLDLQRALKALERSARAVPVSHPPAAEKALAWDAQTVEDLFRTHARARGAREVLGITARVIFGAEPRELSALHLLFYARAAGGLHRLAAIRGGAQQDRFVSGAQELSLGLARELGERVALGAPVSTLRQTAEGVVAETPRGAVRARYAVVTAPPAAAARIVFDPPLPGGRDQLLQRVPMGATVKHVVTYDRPFWRERGLSGEAVSASGPIAAAFDNTSHDNGQPALVAFVAGADARRWSLRSEPDRRRALLRALGRFFGPEAEAPSEVAARDWSEDPWIRGCPVGAPGPGAITGAGAALRQPVGRIHFAGTETATEWNGYLEGALQSAERAAREVRRRL